MDTKYLYINTMGCQMNVYDSEVIANSLEPLGYKLTQSPEKADLILINTCSIREKAEKKTFSLLGRFDKLKQKKKDLIIGVGGCVAQQEGKKILEHVPHLDIVFGTHSLSRLADNIKAIEENRKKIVDVDMTQPKDDNFKYSGKHKGKVSSFVTIMQGCDNFCTYCVVPYVRGREFSKTPDSIMQEITELAANGVKEVTLLGQNVNSYGKKENFFSFAKLLKQINKIDGLFRIRFITSHPKDFSDDLIYAFKDVDKLCNHIHLPVQSGSNKILEFMNRKYTREVYFEKVEKLKDIISDIAFSTDIIVGFPGESEKDFEDTLDLVEKVKFDSFFAFKYSDRPNAPAANFENKVTDEDKSLRLEILLSLHDKLIMEKNSALIGKVVPVLVEDLSKKKRMENSTDENKNSQWMGRTTTNKIVHFLSDDKVSLKSKIVNIQIEKAFPHSLWGCKLLNDL